MKCINIKIKALLFFFQSCFQLSEATRKQCVLYGRKGWHEMCLYARLQLLAIHYGHVDDSSHVSFQSTRMG